MLLVCTAICIALLYLYIVLCVKNTRNEAEIGKLRAALVLLSEQRDRDAGHVVNYCAQAVTDYRSIVHSVCEVSRRLERVEAAGAPVKRVIH